MKSAVHLSGSRQRIHESLLSVQRWVEKADYKGYEPFDGLSSPLHELVRGQLLAERILQQAVRQSPINIRPLLGIRPLESTKGRGAMAWGYLALFKTTGDPSYKTKALACLDWLDTHKSPKFATHSWANYFDFASRGGAYMKDDSIIVWTAMIGQAFLEAFEQFGDERLLRVAESAANWVLALPREKTKQGDCLSYFALGIESIHNASMLGAAFLAHASKCLSRPELADVARSAMLYSCSRQCPDGSWWYGEESKFHWVDNFHTAYNLDSLKTYIECTGDKTFEPQLRLGFQYFKAHFFEESGRPKYYNNRSYPIDIQCASQAIDTLAYFAQDDPDALPLGVKVALWTIEHMQDRRGHFYYRKYPGGVTARTPMLHWGQATMFKALAHLWVTLEAEHAAQ